MKFYRTVVYEIEAGSAVEADEIWDADGPEIADSRRIQVLGTRMPKTKPFSQLADKIDADPERRARVEEHKRAMLAEFPLPDRCEVCDEPLVPGKQHNCGEI